MDICTFTRCLWITVKFAKIKVNICPKKIEPSPEGMICLFYPIVQISRSYDNRKFRKSLAHFEAVAALFFFFFFFFFNFILLTTLLLLNSILHYLHYTLHYLHYTLHYLHYTLYYLHYILHHLHYTLHYLHYTLYYLLKPLAIIN